MSAKTRQNSTLFEVLEFPVAALGQSESSDWPVDTTRQSPTRFGLFEFRAGERASHIRSCRFLQSAVAWRKMGGGMSDSWRWSA